MKIRLDELVVARGMATTLKQARAMIGAGEVFVNDTLADKIGCAFPHEAIL
ncbi:MAG TPA: S4 domain-containing protein [Desulfopila sp.]|nr:S4 domain-containing protein [Desulfopila sp.]